MCPGHDGDLYSGMADMLNGMGPANQDSHTYAQAMLQWCCCRTERSLHIIARAAKLRGRCVCNPGCMATHLFLHCFRATHPSDAVCCRVCQCPRRSDPATNDPTYLQMEATGKGKEDLSLENNVSVLTRRAGAGGATADATSLGSGEANAGGWGVGGGLLSP